MRFRKLLLVIQYLKNSQCINVQGIVLFLELIHKQFIGQCPTATWRKFCDSGELVVNVINHNHMDRFNPASKELTPVGQKFIRNALVRRIQSCRVMHNQTTLHQMNCSTSYGKIVSVLSFFSQSKLKKCFPS